MCVFNQKERTFDMAREFFIFLCLVVVVTGAGCEMEFFFFRTTVLFIPLLQCTLWDGVRRHGELLFNSDENNVKLIAQLPAVVASLGGKKEP